MTHPPGFAFVEAALDRASEHREDVAALAERWARAGLVLVRPDGTVLVEAGGARLCRDPSHAHDAAHASYLGELAGEALFCIAVDATFDAGERRFLDLRRAAAELPGEEAAVAAFARALLHWQSRKRYCGRCGAPTVLLAGGHRALCTNAECAQEYFPRTDPAIITLVTDGERCLLGRQPGWPERRFSTLAGFVEPGETLEQAVAREVHEETGVRVARSRYFASQPWPFPASIMLGFEADAATHEIACGAEIAEAHWFHHADMPRLVASGDLKLPPAMSISYHLIDRWFHARTGAHLPPGQPIAAR
ncbi:MAG TPA: NAD(+) diphosphatase [Xanthomonadales bacterium]|nr:NAD(+) diphosphatase [Xanthomonadales bacterium]